MKIIFLFVCVFLVSLWAYGSGVSNRGSSLVLPPLKGAVGHEVSKREVNFVLPDYYQIIAWIPHLDHPDLRVTEATSREDILKALSFRESLSAQNILSALFLIRKKAPQVFNHVFLPLLERDLWFEEIKKGMNILKDPVLRFQYEIMRQAWNREQSVSIRQKALARLSGYKEMIQKQGTVDLSSYELERFRYLAPDTERWLKYLIARSSDSPLIRVQAILAFQYSSWSNKEETGKFFLKTLLASIEEQTSFKEEKGATFKIFPSHEGHLKSENHTPDLGQGLNKAGISHLQIALLEKLRSPSLADFMQTKVAQSTIWRIAGHRDLSPLVRAHAFWTGEASHFMKEDLKWLKAKMMSRFQEEERLIFVKELTRLQAHQSSRLKTQKTCAQAFS